MVSDQMIYNLNAINKFILTDCKIHVDTFLHYLSLYILVFTRFDSMSSSEYYVIHKK